MGPENELEVSIKMKHEEVDIKNEIIECPSEEANQTDYKSVLPQYDCNWDKRKKTLHSQEDTKKCSFRSIGEQYGLVKYEKNHLDKSSPCDNFEYKWKEQIDIRKLQCTACSYSTSIKHDFQVHIMRKHTSEDQKQYFFCDKCDYKAVVQYDVTLHILRVHTHPDFIEWHQCPYCTSKHKLKWSLTRHIKRKHADKMKIDVEKLQCSECSFSTLCKRNFQVHVMRKHTSEDEKKYFYCDECDYKAVVQCDVNVHILRVHTHPDLIEWLKCPYCPIKYKLKCSLTRHIKRKHSEKKTDFKK